MKTHFVDCLECKKPNSVSVSEYLDGELSLDTGYQLCDVCLESVLNEMEKYYYEENLWRAENKKDF